jgi:hypothetical protein
MQFQKIEANRVDIFNIAVHLYSEGVPMVNYQHDNFSMTPELLGAYTNELLELCDSLIWHTNIQTDTHYEDNLINLCYVLDKNAQQICNHMHYHGMIQKNFETGYYE